MLQHINLLIKAPKSHSQFFAMEFRTCVLIFFALVVAVVSAYPQSTEAEAEDMTESPTSSPTETDDDTTPDSVLSGIAGMAEIPKNMGTTMVHGVSTLANSTITAVMDGVRDGGQKSSGIFKTFNTGFSRFLNSIFG